MRFSSRTGWLRTPNPLAALLNSRREKGIQIFDLTLSNPTRANFRYLDPKLLKPFFDTQNLVYDPDPHGLLQARQALCDFYGKKGIRISPEEIFLTASTSEAYGFVFRLLLDPHETVLAPQPSYPLLDYLAGLNDIRIVRYPLHHLTHVRKDRVQHGGWYLELEELESRREPAPRAVLLVHPNNPTGNYVAEKERAKINEIVLRDKMTVLCDEVFFDFVLDKKIQRPRSFAGQREVLTFTLSGISKILGLPQMKIAWILVSGPEKEKEEAIQKLEVIADTYLSAGTPSQRALRAWFDMWSTIHGEISNRLKDNLAYLTEKFKAAVNVRLLMPEGGWYVMLEVPPIRTDEEWSLLLLEKDDVLIHPGYLFDAEEENLLVLSLLPDPVRFQESIDRLIRRFQETMDVPQV
ncbi:MAG: pyridoxal phosphate-dependent aminotransferase [Candidatus Omnitrophica bacterium]|nr:pyridoxal phosphate-dependent aminotransferase [Candidatus Omnitrophota bacterium]